MDFQNLINSLQFSNIAWEIITPLIFSLCDVITGYIQAFINKNIESQKMREGLLHKIVIVMIVCLSFVIRYSFNLKYITSIISIYIILMETMSILENIKKAGINIGKLGDNLKEKVDKTINENKKEGE